MPPRTPNYGKTPKYLEKYKSQAAHKLEEKAERDAAKLRPPGTIVMPENERIKMVEDLTRNKKDVLGLLNQMPISLSTPSLIRQRDDLERKLTEIEKALNTFNKNVVYIKKQSQF